MLAVYRLNTLQTQKILDIVLLVVSNYDGWKGHGKDSMGTGFIIDGHTYITNLHVVQDSKGKIARPQDVKW